VGKTLKKKEQKPAKMTIKPYLSDATYMIKPISKAYKPMSSKLEMLIFQETASELSPRS
jgi:hypothetical protein